MVEKQDVQPWPVWGRVLFLGGLAVVLVVAAIIAFGSGHVNWAAARIALVVVVVPGLGLLLVSLVSGSREKRSAERLRTGLAATSDLIGQEERRSPAERASGSADHDLAVAAASVAEARRRLEAGQVDQALPLVRRLLDLSDAWHSPSPLAESIRACAQDARRWDRARRTGADARR